MLPVDIFRLFYDNVGSFGPPLSGVQLASRSGWGGESMESNGGEVRHGPNVLAILAQMRLSNSCFILIRN